MNVMLSYQRTDIVFANKLTTYLRRAGFPPWVNREGIKPGQRWRDELFTHDARARLLKNEPPRRALMQPLPPEVDA